MQSSIQVVEALKREMTITVPVEEVKAAYEKRLAEVAKKANINGFRPGKAPTKVIEQRFGKGVLDEIAGQLIQANFAKAVQEDKVKVVGQPTVTEMDVKKDQPLEFKTTFEVYPEIDLKTLEGVEVTRKTSEIKDNDIQKMLEKIQTQHATFDVVERAAKDGDRVLIDFDGTIDGEVFEGGAANQHTLVLGSKSMIPGFESGIEGMSPGDTKDVEVKFPEDYQAEELKGKDAVFKITLHKVEAPKLPPVDDELAKKMQVEGGVDALKEKVIEGMQRELKEKLKSVVKEQVMDKLIELNEFEVPAALITAEIQHLKRSNLSRMASQYGLDVAQLEKINLPDGPYKEQAEKRVRLGLLLAEVIAKFELKLDAERVDAQIKETANYYQKPEEVEQWYRDNKEARSEIEAAVLEDQAVDALLEAAKIVEKDEAYQDVMN